MYETGRFAHVSREDVEAVASQDEFISVVEAMQADLARAPDAWENATLDRFLEALVAATDSLANYYAIKGERLPGTPGWRQFAEILVMASGHE